MAENLEKQQAILDFIQAQIKKQGFPPTVREICEAVGLSSPSTVHGYLKRLEKRGLLKIASSKNRAIRIENTPDTKKDIPPTPLSEYMDVPVIGKVSAGLPILAEENRERTFPLPMDFAHGRDVFMLRVQGDSMINAAILSGDYVIVQKQDIARDGDIIVALIDDSVTVKTYYKEKGHFRLQPENDYMEPIITDHLTVLGKVIGVYRML